MEGIGGHTGGGLAALELDAVPAGVAVDVEPLGQRAPAVQHCLCV